MLMLMLMRCRALGLQRPLARQQLAADRLDPCRVPALGRHHVHLPGLLGLAVGAGMALEGGHTIHPAFMDLLHFGRGRRRC